MATVNDIDTQAAVRKFLDRQVVSDKEDPGANSFDEIQAILEACALTFLLNPQAALTFVLLAKNVLTQIVDAELQMLDYLSKTADAVLNPNELITDTSDLLEAQVALIEVDRIGRVAEDIRAYGRYQEAVSRFLDQQLARTLKRKRLQEFERSGTEAKQDLFRVLNAFSPVHRSMIERLSRLYQSVGDFSSVDLTSIVATRTVSRVRDSLKKVLSGFNQRTLSKTSAAVELLAGASALRSVSKVKDIYDPLVETGVLPVGRTIRASSEPIAARSSHAPIDLTGVSGPWIFSIDVDGVTDVEHYLPVQDAATNPFLITKDLSAGLTFESSKRTLYLQLKGLTPPAGQAFYVLTITFDDHYHTQSDIRYVLANALPSHLYCSDDIGGGRLCVYGDEHISSITVLDSVPGTFSSGDYVPAAVSAHELLGFRNSQVSEKWLISAETLAIVLAETYSGYWSEHYPAVLDVSVEDGNVVVRSRSTAPSSSLVFRGVLSDFPSAVSEPSYLALVERGVEVDPTSAGIIPGSVVTVSDALDSVRDLSAPVSKIVDSHLYFDVSPLPRCQEESVLVVSPLVVAVQDLLSAITPYVEVFSEDVVSLQRALAPLYYNPTQAQIADAKRALTVVRDKVYALWTALGSVVLPVVRNDHSDISNQILRSLEERGLDRALDLLKTAYFSAFFGLSKEKAAKSSRFMLSMEEVGRNDLASTTVEEDIPEQTPKGSTLDEDILLGDNLANDDRETV